MQKPVAEGQTGRPAWHPTTDLEGGLPHSDIRGSKLVRSSPRLFAAYHVLHRLRVPRHPPNALKALDRSHYPCPPGRGPAAQSNRRRSARQSRGERNGPAKNPNPRANRGTGPARATRPEGRRNGPRKTSYHTRQARRPRRSNHGRPAGPHPEARPDPSSLHDVT